MQTIQLQTGDTISVSGGVATIVAGGHTYTSSEAAVVAKAQDAKDYVDQGNPITDISIDVHGNTLTDVVIN